MIWVQLVGLLCIINRGEANFFTMFKSTNVSDEQASNGRIVSLQENNVLSCLVKCKRIETCTVVGVDLTNSVAESLVSCHLYEINNSSKLTNYVYSSESQVYIKDYVDNSPDVDFESTLTSLAIETSTSSDSISTSSDSSSTAMSTIPPPISLSNSLLTMPTTQTISFTTIISISLLTKYCSSSCSNGLNCINNFCTFCTDSAQYYSMSTFQCMSCGDNSYLGVGTNCYKQVSSSADILANHNTICTNAGLNMIVPPVNSSDNAFSWKAGLSYDMSSGSYLTNAKYVSTNPLVVINLATNQQYTPDTGICPLTLPKVNDVVLMVVTFLGTCIKGTSSPTTTKLNSFCQKST